MTVGEFVKYFETVLEPLQWYDRREVRSMASYLLKELADVASYKIIVEPQMELETGVAEKLVFCAERLSEGMPLQYVLGYEYFCGHKFNVAPGVLIPRPETEEQVNMIIGEFRTVNAGSGLRILDICTGSGCIACSLSAGLPGSCVYGCDISDEALSIASSQGVGEVSFFKCDILSADAEGVIGKASDGKFDIIVSNPPYVCEEERPLMRANVLDYEPELALFVPDDNPLLFYRRITELASHLLADGGSLYFEVNERFAKEVALLMAEFGFAGCKVTADMSGKERIVSARLSL